MGVGGSVEKCHPHMGKTLNLKESQKRGRNSAFSDFNSFAVVDLTASLEK